MIEVADIFARYGKEYLDKFGDKMLPSHKRAFTDILHCRTPAMGGHVCQCNRCGRLRYSYHSCRNRNCTKCHTADTQAWLQARQAELLPVPYYHVIFTIPHKLAEFVRLRQQSMYGILMKSAAQSLIKLASDPHYVGGLVGVMAVLHTWGSNLVYHPHVHCLVTGGGLSQDRQRWMPARENYLVPVRALSKLFRATLLHNTKRQFDTAQLPQDLWQKDWVVYCKPAIQGTDKLLNYLGRYVHRVAIANSRILSIDDGKVCFRYTHSKTKQPRIMTVHPHEFIRRFLQHVLPSGVHKVRYYGLWAPSNRKHLCAMQKQLQKPQDANRPQKNLDEPAMWMPSATEPKQCPYCKKGTLIPVQRLLPARRAPP
jgi:hypothetical protein